MSIKPAPVDGQARTAVAPSAAAATIPAKKSHLIFICYPRNTTAQVEVFHAALLKHLKDLSNEYEIFRDIGSDPDNRINSSEDWRKVVDDKLAQSACCLLVLFPVIFERPECEREVELFRALSEQDPSRFFYPITFVSVANRLASLAAEKAENDKKKQQDEIERDQRYDNAVARIADRLQAFDFIGYQFKNKSDPNAYEQKVAEIAAEIDRRINAPPTREGTVAVAATAAPRPIRRYALAGAVAAAVVVAGGIYAAWPLLFPKPEVAQPKQPPEPPPGALVETTFEPVVPLRLLTAPKAGAPAATQMLGPDPIAPGVAPVVRIRLVSVDGGEWYEFELDDGSKVYLEKDRMPMWSPLDRNIELVEPVQAFAKPIIPTASDAPGRTLRPGDLERSARRRAPTSGNVERKLWYRVAAADGDMFFAADGNADRLVQWQPLAGCLEVTRRLTLLSEPNASGVQEEDKLPGQILKDDVQAGEVRKNRWYRLRGSDGSFRYLRQADVKEASGDKCG